MQNWAGHGSETLLPTAAVVGSALSLLGVAYLSFAIRNLRSKADLSVHRGLELLDKCSEIRQNLTNLPVRVDDLERGVKNLHQSFDEHTTAVSRQVKRMNKWAQEDSGTAKGGPLSRGVLEAVKERLLAGNGNGEATPPSASLSAEDLRTYLANGGM